MNVVHGLEIVTYCHGCEFVVLFLSFLSVEKNFPPAFQNILVHQTFLPPFKLNQFFILHHVHASNQSFAESKIRSSLPFNTNQPLSSNS